MSTAPTNPKQGDTWLDTSTNELWIYTDDNGNKSTMGKSMTYAPYVPLTVTSAIPSNLVINSSSLNTFKSNFSMNAKAIEYSFTDGKGNSAKASADQIVQMVAARDELTKLCQEQTSVQEAYERLQVLIKLYRE